MASKTLLFFCLVALLRPLWGFPLPRNDGKTWLNVLWSLFPVLESFGKYAPFGLFQELKHDTLAFFGSWNAKFHYIMDYFQRDQIFLKKLTREYAFISRYYGLTFCMTKLFIPKSRTQNSLSSKKTSLERWDPTVLLRSIWGFFLRMCWAIVEDRRCLRPLEKNGFGHTDALLLLHYINASLYPNNKSMTKWPHSQLYREKPLRIMGNSEFFSFEGKYKCCCFPKVNKVTNRVPFCSQN